MITITKVEGHTVYFEGTVQISQDGQELSLTGFDTDVTDTITHQVDTAMMQSIPGTGAGRLLVYIYKKAKQLLCPECTSPTNPE